MSSTFASKRPCRSVLQCVAMCCSMLQCVAVCCSVLQCQLQRVVVCCSVSCSVVQCITSHHISSTFDQRSPIFVRKALSSIEKSPHCSHPYYFTRGMALCSKEPYIRSKEPHIRSNEPNIRSKEPFVQSKEPYTASSKENYIRSKEPYIRFDPFHHTRKGLLRKRTPFSFKQPHDRLKYTYSHFSTNPCSVKRDVFSFKTALFSMKRDLFLTIRALYSITRASLPKTQESVLCTKKPQFS